MKKPSILMLILALLIFYQDAFSQDKKFYIFICFGQSNMEGSAPFQSQDTIVNPRIQVLEALDCPDLGRKKGEWYTAVPPITRCSTGLTPADYFARTVLAGLPKDVRVGIINVAVGGCKIELFDKDNYQSYTATSPSWMKKILDDYDGNPYRRMLELASIAQKSGVIKGILMHQGESNTGDQNWPSKVKNVYSDILNDLKLNAREVPLLAGEVVNADQNGICASMNTIIATLPKAIPTAHIISSAGCPAGKDNLHFTAEGYRMLGKRYGEKMLALLSDNIK